MKQYHFNPKSLVVSGKRFYRSIPIHAIHFQWQQLEKSGCIENFRICAGKSNKPRTGLFFSDSDAYKWLDAACRILRQDPQPDLQELVDDFVELIQAAQAEDGYLYTYNQIIVSWQPLE